MTCQRRADGAAPQRSTHCLPLIGFNFQTANAQDVLRSSIASLSENVSRTRCSVLPAMRSIVRSRCTAEPGPKGNPRGAWAPDQQRTTPQGRRAAQHPGHANIPLSSRGADSARVVHVSFAQERAWALPEGGERGMPGARCTRSRACRIGSTRVSHHGRTGTPGIPAREWF
jgi:hypothetical protein